MVNAILILTSILFLVILNYLSLNANFLFLFALIGLFRINNISFFNLIGKIKYFLLALLLIYSLSTPGKVIFFYAFFSITEEGILLGVNNLLRILNTFMIVSVLIKTTPKESLISFIVKIFYPLKLFGLDVDRLTVRLYLTLSYLEKYKKYPFKYNDLFKLINKDINLNKLKNIEASIIKITPSYLDIFVFCGFFVVLIILNFIFLL